MMVLSGTQSEPAPCGLQQTNPMSEYTNAFMAEQIAHLTETGGIDVEEKEAVIPPDVAVVGIDVQEKKVDVTPDVAVVQTATGGIDIQEKETVIPPDVAVGAIDLQEKEVVVTPDVTVVQTATGDMDIQEKEVVAPDVAVFNTATGGIDDEVKEVAVTPDVAVFETETGAIAVQVEEVATPTGAALKTATTDTVAVAVEVTKDIITEQINEEHFEEDDNEEEQTSNIMNNTSDREVSQQEGHRFGSFFEKVQFMVQPTLQSLCFTSQTTITAPVTTIQQKESMDDDTNLQDGPQLTQNTAISANTEGGDEGSVACLLDALQPSESSVMADISEEDGNDDIAHLQGSSQPTIAAVEQKDNKDDIANLQDALQPTKNSTMVFISQKDIKDDIEYHQDEAQITNKATITTLPSKDGQGDVDYISQVTRSSTIPKDCIGNIQDSPQGTMNGTMSSIPRKHGKYHGTALLRAQKSTKQATIATVPGPNDDKNLIKNIPACDSSLQQVFTMSSNRAIYGTLSRKDMLEEEGQKVLHRDLNGKILKKNQSHRDSKTKKEDTKRAHKIGENNKKSGKRDDIADKKDVQGLKKSENHGGVKKGIHRLFFRPKEQQISEKPPNMTTGPLKQKEKHGSAPHGHARLIGERAENSPGETSKSARSKSRTRSSVRDGAIETRELNPRRPRTASPRRPMGQRRQTENERGGKRETRDQCPTRTKQNLESKVRRARAETSLPRVTATEPEVPIGSRHVKELTRTSRGRSRQPRELKRPQKTSGSGKQRTGQKTHIKSSKKLTTNTKLNNKGETRKVIGKPKKSSATSHPEEKVQQMMKMPRKNVRVHSLVRHGRNRHSNQPVLRHRE